MQQTERVGHGSSALPDPRGNLVVGQGKVFDELLKGCCFFQRVEVGPMNILHQCFLEGRRVTARTNEGGDPVEAEPAGRPPPTLAGDQLELIAHGAYENRLQDSDFSNRVGQRGEEVLVESLTWLMLIRANRRDLNFLECPRGLGAARWNQGSESFTQSAASRHCLPPWPVLGTQPRRERWGRTK